MASLDRQNRARENWHSLFARFDETISKLIVTHCLILSTIILPHLRVNDPCRMKDAIMLVFSFFQNDQIDDFASRVKQAVDCLKLAEQCAEKHNDTQLLEQVKQLQETFQFVHSRT
jgi:hypothetical protein